MITAYDDADTKRKALEGRAEALLTKPSILLRFAARSTTVWRGWSRGPLRVKRVTLTVRRSLPVFSNKRTYSEFVGMSQTC